MIYHACVTMIRRMAAIIGFYVHTMKLSVEHSEALICLLKLFSEAQKTASGWKLFTVKESLSVDDDDIVSPAPPPPSFSHSIWKRVRYEIHHNQHYQHHVRNFFSCETTAGEEMEKYVYNLL